MKIARLLAVRIAAGIALTIETSAPFEVRPAPPSYSTSRIFGHHAVREMNAFFREYFLEFLGI
jgi:hypothetical protein